jgi:hypothetical protein
MNIEEAEITRLQQVEKAAITCLESLRAKTGCYTSRESYLEETLLAAFGRSHEPLQNMRCPPPRSLQERIAASEKPIAYELTPDQTMRLSPESVPFFSDPEVKAEVRRMAQTQANNGPTGYCLLYVGDDFFERFMRPDKQ